MSRAATASAIASCFGEAKKDEFVKELLKIAEGKKETRAKDVVDPEAVLQEKYPFLLKR